MPRIVSIALAIIFIVAIAGWWAFKSPPKSISAAPTTVAVPSIPTFAQPLNPKQIFAKTIPAMVRIVATDASGNPITAGTGFIISPNGIVATNYHVVFKGERIIVTLHDGREQEVQQFIAADPTSDIILLKLDQGSYDSLELTTDLPDVGSKVYAIGNPLGLENTLSDGIVSGIRRKGIRNSLIQITASISPGSSGGPVMGDDGKVIGVATESMRGGQNLNLATPVAVINRLRERAVDVPQPMDHCPQWWLHRAEAMFAQMAYPKKVDAVSGTRRSNMDAFIRDLTKLHVQLGDLDGAFALSRAIDLQEGADSYTYREMASLLAETGDLASAMNCIAIADHKDATDTKRRAELPYENTDSSISDMREDSYNNIILVAACTGEHEIVDELAARIKSPHGRKILTENQLIGEIVKSPVDSAQFLDRFNEVIVTNSLIWLRVGRIERCWGNNTLAAIAFSNARKCAERDIKTGKLSQDDYLSLSTRIAQAAGDIAQRNKDVIAARTIEEPNDFSRAAELALVYAEIGDTGGARTSLTAWEKLCNDSNAIPSDPKSLEADIENACRAQVKLGDMAAYERTAKLSDQLKGTAYSSSYSLTLGFCGDIHRFRIDTALLLHPEDCEALMDGRNLDLFVFGLLKEGHWNETKIFISTLHSPALLARAYFDAAQSIVENMTDLEN